MRSIVTCFLFFLYINIGFCEKFELALENIKYTVNGASKQNWGIDRDSNGYMYFANNNGLLEYNGSEWGLYTLPDKLTVRSVKVDTHKKIIYTGAYHEFGYWYRLKNGRLQYVSLSEKAPPGIFHNDEIWRIIPDTNKVYFQSFSNIYVYENDSIHVISPQANMVFLMKVGNNLFVQLDGLGLFSLKNNQLELIAGSEVLADGVVRTILPYKSNQYLIGSGTKGLFIYDSKTFSEWNTPVQKNIKNDQINAGYFDGKYYYIGTIMSGLYVFDQSGNVVVNYSTSNHLQNNTVLGISSDNENNVWLALDRGIDVIKNNNNYYKISSDKNILGSVYSAALYNNSLYLATNRGVYKHPFRKDNLISIKLENFREVSGIKGQTWCLNIFDNQLLCGHNEGSYIIHDSKSEKISPISGGYNFKPMFINNEQYLIQSTYYHLVMYENTDNKWKVKNIFYEVREPITDIEVGSERYIWASHYLKGVYRMHLSEDLNKIETISFYSKNKGFPSEYYNRVTKIAGRISFTSTNGILTYDDLNDTIIPFNKIKEKLGDFYFAQKVVPIGNDKYWFIRDNEIALFKINQDTICLIQKQNFNNSGVSLVEQYENIVSLNDSLSIICFENGFCVTFNQKNEINTENNKVLFTRIEYTLNDEVNQLLPINDKNLVLSYGKNEIEFDVTVSNQHSKDIQYQFKLDGYEDRWSALSHSSKMKYHQLPWGKYTFLVQAMVNNSVKLPVKEFKFIVKTPWYYSIVAIVSYIIIGVLILLLLITRVKRFYKRKEEREIKRYEAECLQKEVSYKSKELAISAMSIIKKNEILIKIKEELDKQKDELGTRYPQKFYSSLTKIIDINISDTEEWEIFEHNFNQANDNLFTRMKSEFSDLTPHDLRLCAFLRLNLTSKEIAPLLGITVRGVETSRYRLRQKFNLNNNDNLVEFVMNY